MQPHEQRSITAHNQLFIVIEPFTDIRIESVTGLFDMSEENTNELQYEHREDILLINNSLFVQHARFIQVIPKICDTLCQ